MRRASRTESQTKPQLTLLSYRIVEYVSGQLFDLVVSQVNLVEPCGVGKYVGVKVYEAVRVEEEVAQHSLGCEDALRQPLLEAVLRQRAAGRGVVRSPWPRLDGMQRQGINTKHRVSTSGQCVCVFWWWWWWGLGVTRGCVKRRPARMVKVDVDAYETGKWGGRGGRANMCYRA